MQSSKEFIGNYNTRLWPESNYNHSSIFLMAFDAMWSMAQMLNYTEEMRLADLPGNHSDFDECRHLDGSLVPLDEFNYTNAFMGCVMRDNYYKIDFTGVSVSSLLSIIIRDIVSTYIVAHEDILKGRSTLYKVCAASDRSKCPLGLFSDQMCKMHTPTIRQGPAVRIQLS